jgi:hypothetical protein
MDLFDYSLCGAPLAFGIAVVALVWRRWVLPLICGLFALPVGAVAGRFAWEWFADRPPGFDFGYEFEGFDWVIGFASVAALLGVLLACGCRLADRGPEDRLPRLGRFANQAISNSVSRASERTLVSERDVTLASEMDAAVWTAIGLLAATSLGTLFYLGSRMDALAARLDARMDAGFARMDAGFARVDSRFDAIEARFDGLASRLDAHLDHHAS